MEFLELKKAVAKQFAAMAKKQLFVVGHPKVNGEDVNFGDILWEYYQDTFPEGTNPMFRERREYDCNTCRRFVRAVGHVVTINDDGTLSTIWDVKLPKTEPEFQVVADAMSAYVKSFAVVNLLMTSQPSAGEDRNFEFGEHNKRTEWNHFYVTIPSSCVLHKDNVASALGDKRSSYDVFYRALREITTDAIDTVADLIKQKFLYRGKEFEHLVLGLKDAKKKFDQIPVDKQANYAWVLLQQNLNISHVRNTSIGSLLVDLSADEDLESAVGKYEAKVAPANYKRPTALVTDKMVNEAKKKVEELGLMSALSRRFANIHDIAIDNVLFANRNVRHTIADEDPFSGIGNKKPAKVMQRVQNVGIRDFLDNVLPTAVQLEVLFTRDHTNRLVSLITSEDPTSNNLFKWDNHFSWSYVGELADSDIKRRVKAAGGNVDGDFCIRLAWYNHDDLDLSCTVPGSDRPIYFAHRRNEKTQGNLDVDMNCGRGTSRTPVENIVFPDASRLVKGQYVVKVHNFCKRESHDVGFDLEIAFMGQTWNLHYDKAVRDGERIEAAIFEFDGREMKLISGKVKAGATKSQETWGIKTEEFVQVSAVMQSPNFWNGQQIGNEHIFFMLEGCQNDNTARGFYNEFLKEELSSHRKVLEMVGSKNKVAATEHQLSGIGFSTTQRGEVTIKVTTATTVSTFNVTF